MDNQKLFEALERVCGFTALETDMFEIIKAVEADKMPMTETIEQAAESNNDLAYWRANAEEDYLTTPISVLRYIYELETSQPNPHRIKEWQVMELNDMYFTEQISHNRMVEILNEIAAGKHKERIEL